MTIKAADVPSHRDKDCIVSKISGGKINASVVIADVLPQTFDAEKVYVPALGDSTGPIVMESVLAVKLLGPVHM